MPPPREPAPAHCLLARLLQAEQVATELLEDHPGHQPLHLLQLLLAHTGGLLQYDLAPGRRPQLPSLKQLTATDRLRALLAEALVHARAALAEHGGSCRCAVCTAAQETLLAEVLWPLLDLPAPPPTG